VLSGVSKALRETSFSWEGSKAAGPMRMRQSLQPRDRCSRKGEWPSRSCHGEGNRLHLEDRSGGGRSRGNGESTWRQPDTEQERPSPAVHVGRSDGYKPTAKSHRVGRESEGLIVPSIPVETRAEGRGPALVTLACGGKCEGMVA